ncbi:uncharacterized protein LOC104899868 [Beta vulgaris subsp. vulgaris]|uniref:uncharacterized protein LOC104899868 n=1 Tax=Beta vulgaris subsp. vulgaris TaxID=3555 RepID=UPI00053F95BF|nr:uncharacterized protein LOC104899868 [Beta vulgaris subsp. vulgaris]
MTGEMTGETTGEKEQRRTLKEFSVQVIEAFQKCHGDHPFGKICGKCTELKIKLDRCFMQEINLVSFGVSGWWSRKVHALPSTR